MHKSVLLNEVLEGLFIKEDGIYVDATLGFGGHSGYLLKRIKKGFLFAFDQDDMAIMFSEGHLSAISDNFKIIKDNFMNMTKRLNENDITSVDGIMFDLGVSSPQLDVDERGFSYHKDARLDMRMDRNNPLSAYEIVNNYPYEKLVDIFYRFGEEANAKNIAKRIVKIRENKKVETTLELVDIIRSAFHPSQLKKEHPGRKVFQAIRIEVNRELEVLETALNDAIKLLKPKGRLCVITFHSLEDRIVKNVFKSYSEVPDIIKGLPDIPDEYKPKIKIINKKVIVPSDEELESNNRSRSAKLRIIEKL